jgi:hypothetical protein
MNRIKREAVLIYRPLLYVAVIMLIVYQSYVIWQDRLDTITLVTYSYRVGDGRAMDTAFVHQIKYSTDYINACVLIEDKTQRVGVLIHSWQNLYADRQTEIGWRKR